MDERSVTGKAPVGKLGELGMVVGFEAGGLRGVVPSAQGQQGT